MPQPVAAQTQAPIVDVAEDPLTEEAVEEIADLALVEPNMTEEEIANVPDPEAPKPPSPVPDLTKEQAAEILGEQPPSKRLRRKSKK
jgi:hypothetical protein